MTSRTARRAFAVLALAAAAGAGAWVGYTGWRITSASLPAAAGGTTFDVKPGESLSRVAHKLARRGVLEHAWDLTVLARLRGEGRHVQAGEYRVAPGASVSDVLAMLVGGAVVMHRFTIVPGETFHELRAKLAADPVFHDDLEGLDGSAVMRKLGHADESPEGRFLPDTYAFPRGTRNSAVLARAYASMQHFLSGAWQDRATGLPFHQPRKAVILASIVEKETAVPDERARIAGVFVRRLERGMYLDADPTVIYGLGPTFDGNLTRADLHRATPYNTYVHRGLPPTPICMPGRAAIEAALHPAPGKALYFVARGDGTHVFSDTLAEQEKMIRKYQLHEPAGNGNGGG